MEVKIREVVISSVAIESLEKIYEYGIETFALNAATVFIDELYTRIYNLSTEYLLHPECSFLITKKNVYRNIIHGNYIIIYRITTRIEVLNALHGSRKPSKIKATKKIII